MNIPFLNKRPSTGKIYCTAPFTSVVVDPNKLVRPCCTFGGHMGSLETESLADILSGPEWSEVKRQVTAGETPPGCVKCYEREKATGWSLRLSLYDPKKAATDRWRKGLTQLEINSSNICNLACTHCTAEFSSRWVQLNDKFGKEVTYHHGQSSVRIHGPDPENIVRQLATLDLSRLEEVRFKGGEPMLNHDVPAVLGYLRDRGILQNVTVMMVSNGSLVTEKVVDLFRQAGRVQMCISVDGMGKLQEYIRRGPSEITRIERFIDTLSALKKIKFALSVSVMAYNVFSLDTISEWWNDLGHKYPGKLPPLEFGLHVVEPAYLSVSVLQDPTRERLIQKYRRLSNAKYTSVLHSLAQPFAGVALHNEFVTYTRDMDKAWSLDVLQVVPELERDMVLLQDSGPQTTGRSRWGMSLSRDVESQSHTLQEGMSLSDAGKYTETLRLYDRYLEATSAETLASKWEIRLHRAIVLGKMEEWEQSHEELYSLTQVAPHRTLKAMEWSENAAQGSVLGAISQNLGRETGFVQAPSFRLLMEGLSYRALENNAEAAVRLDKALELDPEFALAKVAKKAMHPVA